MSKKPTPFARLIDPDAESMIAFAFDVDESTYETKRGTSHDLSYRGKMMLSDCSRTITWTFDAGYDQTGRRHRQVDGDIAALREKVRHIRDAVAAVESYIDEAERKLTAHAKKHPVIPELR